MFYFFNLYFKNIDEKINRFQYWIFILGVFGLIIILSLLEINLEINLEVLVNILSLAFIWPTITITIKRLNDIGSENFLLNIIIAAITTIMPGWYNIDFYAMIILGIIPSNYIPYLKECWYVYKKQFND